MNPERDSLPLSMSLCGVGAALSFFIAATPQASIGYFLHVDVLLAGLLPYFIYAMGAWLRRGWLAPILGTLLLAGDIGLRLPADYTHNQWDGAIFIWPLVATVGLVLAYWLIPEDTGEAAHQDGADNANTPVQSSKSP